VQIPQADISEIPQYPRHPDGLIFSHTISKFISNPDDAVAVPRDQDQGQGRHEIGAVSGTKDKQKGWEKPKNLSKEIFNY
jgi:hypothetical protein